MGFLDEETRGPVTVVILRAEDLQADCIALQAAISDRKKGAIGEFYPLFVLNPSAEGTAGSDLIYRAWKLGLQLQDDTGWNLRVEFRRGIPAQELETYSGELQAARVYLVQEDDPKNAILKSIIEICKKQELELISHTASGRVSLVAAKDSGAEDSAAPKEKPSKPKKAAKKKTTKKRSTKG